MAIGVHVAKILRDTTVSDGTEIVEDNNNADNTAGSPTVEEYIELEAGDDYLPVFNDGRRLVTADVGDINAAT